jgi:predicted molibdopterin-dependent oxidoreductase YjgC
MSLQIHIDERPLRVDQGITILQAARQHGIYIPTLCDFPGLPSHGSCRMCLVEIEGRPTTPTACTTPVEEGMRIHTSSPRVQALRSEILQMLLSEHPSSCLFCQETSHCDECMVTLRKVGVTTGCGSCPKDEQCALQELVRKIGLPGISYPIHYRMLPVEKYDPFFDRDYNLCVLCGRCIRVCGEHHFNNILDYTSRGTNTVVGTAFHRTHLEAGCSFCGACVEVCPTGALAEKTRKWDGVPERETVSTCPLCSIGCQVRLLSKNSRVIGSLPDHASGTEALCVQGRFGITELVNHPTRLKAPQKLAGTDPLEIAWDEAIQIAAEKLSACDPRRFALRVSPSCTNEELYVARKFAREVMRSGSHQAHNEERICEISTLLGESQLLSRLSETETILCIGLDGQYAQSVVEVQLHQAQKRGAKMITIHPAMHSLGAYADEWLQPLPGKEAELIRALAERIKQPLPLGRPPARSIERAAGLLRAAVAASNAPAIILGPSCISHPGSAQLLAAVRELADRSGAWITILPEQGNLAGSLLLDSLSPVPGEQELDVLYLVGEAIPAGLPGSPFILYQNIYPPAGSRLADLTLPAAAFTEEDGTIIDYSGRVRQIHPAVQPPGQALPSWQILCRIARAMGAPGFDYESAADIQAEIAASLPGFGAGRAEWRAAPQTALASDVLCSHAYLGFPLTRFVEGLRMLYSEEILHTD